MARVIRSGGVGGSRRRKQAAEALLPWAKDPIPPPPAEEMPRLAKLVHRKVT